MLLTNWDRFVLRQRIKAGVYTYLYKNKITGNGALFSYPLLNSITWRLAFIVKPKKISNED